MIDSLMDKPLQSAVKEGKAPALQFLINNGRYYPKMVSSYPTMSVTIDSTLLTGTYAEKHKVPALVWYDEQEKRFISYGSDTKEIFKLGPKQVFKESMFHLNEHHLSDQVKTIHEELGDRGLQSASINTLVFRGNNTHMLHVPKFLEVFHFLNKDASVKGPSYFSYGILSTLNPKNKYTRFWQGLGFNDKYATEELKYLIEQDRIPSFSLVYFSDNDKKVHKKGVNETKGIEEADKRLQTLFNKYDSWEKALKDNVWIVMGDSGQTSIESDKEKALVDLRKVLKDYRIHKISGPIQKQDQIVLGLNERMSFIYLLDESLKHEFIAKQLQKDKRIDTIAWKEGKTLKVISGDKKGVFSFQRTGKFIDQYGQSWKIDGDTHILDITIKNGHSIVYGDYPDALARLSSSFYSHTGNFLVVNAKPGFEFIGEGSPTHVGGASHGSLHKQDTYFPMIVTGTELEPKHLRMVDVKEWILNILDE
ncbi:alkaline phosphatase family protein [Peribacillus cavernae]|uniref:Alkaline phosphatase family protein n=2 Tax=Peribacillus cavernae TaxID=1674310 RepID=A0A3S0U1W7_9BACI|nr:alkaline phosphatase family protein [Peribacillus cavernae]RUQ29399.1 alkaline phosphatase family protein [Peribacillus cavernae]